jgi:ketosteroid isomerase-like protein
MTARNLDLERANKDAIRAAFDDWAAGRGGPFALLAPDATWTIVGHSPVSRTFASRQEFLDLVIHPFNARLASPLVPRVRALYADGDTVIAFFDAAATAKDGRPYANTYRAASASVPPRAAIPPDSRYHVPHGERPYKADAAAVVTTGTTTHTPSSPRGV